ncbi:unnamed protein product, partial [Medioppia subpectinata]
MKYLVILLLACAGCLADNLNNRLDCYLELDMQVSEQQCKDRGCIWDSTGRPPGVPICYLDPKQVGYKVPAGVKKTDTGLEADLHLKDTAKRTLKSMP